MVFCRLVRSTTNVQNSKLNLNCRYITTEELEQALREKGLLDGREMKDIISEVDADNVSLLLPL